MTSEVSAPTTGEPMLVTGPTFQSDGLIRLGPRRNGTRRVHVCGPVRGATLRAIHRCAVSLRRDGAEQILVVLDGLPEDHPPEEVEELSVALGDLGIPAHVLPPGA